MRKNVVVASVLSSLTAERPLSANEANKQAEDERTVQHIKHWCDSKLVALRFPSHGELTGTFVRACRHDYGSGPKAGAVVKFSNGFHAFYDTYGSTPAYRCPAPPPPWAKGRTVTQTTTTVVSVPTIREVPQFIQVAVRRQVTYRSK